MQKFEKKCYSASHKIIFISLLLYFVVLLFSELEFILKSFSFFGVVAGVGGMWMEDYLLRTSNKSTKSKLFSSPGCCPLVKG